MVCLQAHSSKGFKPIIMKRVGGKAIKMIYTTDAKAPTKNVAVPEEDRRRLVISDEEVVALARMACTIEEHYSAHRGCAHAHVLDTECTKDDRRGELFIVQARPETVHS